MQDDYSEEPGGGLLPRAPHCEAILAVTQGVTMHSESSRLHSAPPPQVGESLNTVHGKMQAKRHPHKLLLEAGK